MEPIRLVVCVCEARDIRVWEIASERIARHIPAQRHLLVCPDAQIGMFRKASHEKWEIVGESMHAKFCSPEMIRSRVRGQNITRVNWLFQQFLKINAIIDSGLHDGDIALIWDADTIPLRDILFVERDGRLSCYHGRERHAPYFRTIEALLGFGRTSEVSFIAQCLPLRVGWLRGLIKEIEGRSGLPYVEAILKQLPGESGAEFSEYETIGSWVLRNSPEALVFRKRNRWLRSGSSLFPRNLSGVAAHLLFRALALRFDFVSIESWKPEPAMRRIIRKFGRRCS